MLRAVSGGKVWTDDVNRKILPDSTPPQESLARGIEISAARGEFESFQIAVTADSALHAVNWNSSDLSGVKIISRAALRCRRIETIRIDQTQGHHGHRGWNPDPLTDRRPCDIPPGTTQGFWFTLCVPRDQPAGMYRGELSLSVDHHESTPIPLILQVRNFDVPERPSIDVCSGLRRDVVLPRENGENGKVLRRYYRDIFEHRSRYNACVSVRVRLKGDDAILDATEYLQHLRFLRDELGAGATAIPPEKVGGFSC